MAKIKNKARQPITRNAALRRLLTGGPWDADGRRSGVIHLTFRVVK